MKQNENTNYRDILFQQFEKKKIRNSRYSLRAFARDLEVPVSRLSDVFNSKKSPSMPMATHMALKMGLGTLQKEIFTTSVQLEKEKIQARKSLVEKRLEILQQKAKSQWTLEHFEQVSKWLDHSICVALSLAEPPKTAEQIAQMFGVEVSEVKVSLEKILAQNDIVKTENGWLATDETSLTPDDKPSSAIRKFHTEILTKAKASLVNDPMEVRDFTSIIFSVNLQELPILKKRIAEMRDQLMMEFGAAKDCDAVYDLSFFLFPISKMKRNSLE